MRGEKSQTNFTESTNLKSLICPLSKLNLSKVQTLSRNNLRDIKDVQDFYFVNNLYLLLE